MDKLTKEDYLCELSKRGNFTWLLEEDQKMIWEFILNIGDSRSLVLHISRRYGKSFVLNLLAYSAALGNETVCKTFGIPRRGAQIAYLAETQAQIQTIFIPNMEIIFRHLPSNMHPKWDQKRNGYVLPTTRSIIRVAGTDNKNYEKLRGGETHLALLDEAAFHDDLDYIYKSIILPQTMRAKGRVLFVSTSPKTPDHEFFNIAQEHIKKDRYLKLTIDDKTTISKETKDELIAEMGGIDSTDVRRELYCEWVTDFNSMILPECTETFMQKVVVDEVKLPESYDWYAAMDPGSVDYTGYLCAYYDFIRAKIVIVGELFFQHTDTDFLSKEIDVIEKKWFGSKPPTHRVCDNSHLTLIADLANLHGQFFSPTRKDDKEAMVNFTRVLFKQGKIEIHKSCDHLIRQCKTGLWNKSRSSFLRSLTEGHYDLIDALIYLCRIIQQEKNPFPMYAKHITANDWHIPSMEDTSQSSTIRNVFKL